MVTAVPTTTTNGTTNGTSNGYHAVSNGKDLSLKIEAEAIAEFDKLKELVEEIRQAHRGLPACEEYEKMVAGEPYVPLLAPRELHVNGKTRDEPNEANE